MAALRELLARSGSFVVATEIVTSRGLVTANGSGGVLGLARELADDPRIDFLSITDNPGGNAMFSPDALGTDMISRGQEVIIHLACKDWNRNALESRGWQLGSSGFHNVLALSGDYPIMGHKGLAAPVFDIDSVGLLGLLAEMNEGLPDARKPELKLDRTDFFLGCVVTNHKRHEREVMPQYFKLRKKAQAGARFVINQIGWDVRKDDELLRWIRRERLELYALANVYLLSRPAARAFHRGKIPGVVVTDGLLELAERHGESPDKGRAFFVDLAAKHVAVARGLGFDGVYLGGHTPAATFGEILDLAGTFAPDDWRSFVTELRHPFDDEFYFYEPDPQTGLSSDTVNAGYLESRRRRRTDLRVPFPTGSAAACTTASSRPRRRSTPPAGRSTAVSSEGREPRARAAHALEQAAKVTLFDCHDCGDCSLPRSPTSAPSRSAPRTSATGRAAEHARGCARSTTANASGLRPTSA